MSSTSDHISALISVAGPGHVWVPGDFAQLGNRDVIDKTLQRMVASGHLRRIDRGLYDQPIINSLTHRPTTPDYRAVIDALARRDQARMLIDGMTAANELGLTDAVPARVTIHTDMRRRSIQIDQLTIEFKLTAPSRLYWAGHPAMRVVQALHWLKDMLATDGDTLNKKLARILNNAQHGKDIRADLAQGFAAMPGWMQDFLRAMPDFDPTMPPHPKKGQDEPRL
ncbi:DUF6088 family protein [Aquabacterium sp.]|uniref:DUF6088 family protein n=1 Tax=Aquabacterium sp. TaxID=1872578 RepID=UPI0019A837B7|nr:DUF6088 family protein [Aquabacterium sp.]MBC7702126.1 hypothetical protein [Aquabacterium sp.]